MAGANKIDISVVVPVFNSAASLPKLAGRLENTMQATSFTFELILVDDCSSDQTWSVIKELHEKKKSLKAIRLKKNCGQWLSTLIGISRAQGDYIVTIDDDLEYSPEDILKLHEHILKKDLQVVFGIAEQKYQLQGKNGKIAKWRNYFLNFLWNKPVTDSFRIFKRQVVFNGEKFLPQEPIEVFLQKNASGQWGYCQVNFNKRYAGTSNHGLFKKIHLFFLFSAYYRGGLARFIFILSSIILLSFLIFKIWESNSYLFIAILSLTLLSSISIIYFYLAKEKAETYPLGEELG